ncbi:MAG: DUF1080 domain-containing protein [Verrucomicrobiae bacterium]|nr:DUF1080 domain-containing protein [Verrucomicrobiae bacterium]
MLRPSAFRGARNPPRRLPTLLLGVAAGGLGALIHDAAAAAVPAIASPAADTAAGWIKSADNPVLGGSLGTCFDVSVMREGDRHRMWFSWRPRKSVALVESRDGVHWSEPRIVLGPRPESGWEDDINRPVVIKRHDGYHAWYTGQARDQSWIGYATSPDGVTWTRASRQPVLSPEQPWEKEAVMCPHVIWDEAEGLYRMWYSGGEQYEPDAIGYAVSPDGVNWAKHAGNPVFRSDSRFAWESHKVTGCQVVRQGDWHVMFYIGFQDRDHAQIGIARSRDGITGWERHPANPIIRPTADGWDHDACYKPFALLDDGTWRLWYNGRHGSAEQIGQALHEGEDLGFEAARTDALEFSRAEPGFVSLFDGKTLEGWTIRCLPKDRVLAARAWTVDQGTILADTMGHTGHFYIMLVSRKEYGDFVLRLRLQVERGITGNSGIQIRSRYDPETGWMEGPQIDINPPGPELTGKLWNEGPGPHRWLSNETIEGQKFHYADEGDGWNDLEITANGMRIRSVLNGVTVVDYDGSGVLDDEPHRKLNVGTRGRIGLQIHSYQELKLRFKDVRIREASP